MNSTPQVSGTILAISGSLRRSSINSAVLRAAAAAAARDGALIVVEDSVRELPHAEGGLENIARTLLRSVATELMRSARERRASRRC